MAFVDVLTIRMEEFEGGKIGLSSAKADVGRIACLHFLFPYTRFKIRPCTQSESNED